MKDRNITKLRNFDCHVKSSLPIFLIILVLCSSFIQPRNIYAHDNKYVHPYIAEQAFLLCRKELGEMSNYLGHFRGETPTSLINPMYGILHKIECDNASSGKTITEGTSEEDVYDPAGEVCLDLTSLLYGFYHHFYDPDVSSGSSGLFNNLSAVDYAQIYWYRAIELYSDVNTRPEAYWYLGRVAHLLGDMSVPAHVHRDLHLPLEGGDSYEKYMENSYTNYGWTDAKNLDSQSPIPPQWTLKDLFYNLAQRTQYFPSNGEDGDTSNTQPSWFDGWTDNPNSMRECGIDVIDATCQIKDSDCLLIGNKLMPLVIQYTAALYKLFWAELHMFIEAPEYITALTPVTVIGRGTVNGKMPDYLEWDFDYNGTGTFASETSGLTVTIPAERYKNFANTSKTIAIRANGDDSTIQTKTIYIQQYPITITAPDGYSSLERHFSTPESSLIDRYEWNYGDSTPKEEGREQEHTYIKSGYYKITLTLFFEDGSTTKSEESIFVGPGTRYIQGHTIYGNETWYAGGTYIIQGSITVNQGATLTIQSGVEAQLSGGVQLNIYGTLKATGATFTWADGQNQWYGIRFRGEGANGSVLDNCIVEHASGVNGYGGEILGVIDCNASSPTIKGCIINGSYTYGIQVYKGSFPSVSGNRIENHLKGGILIQPDSGGTYQGNTFSDNTYGILVSYSKNNPVISGNSYSGNKSGDLYAYGSIEGNIQWTESGDVVYCLSYLTVAEGASLTIGSGRMIKLDKNAQIYVYGTLKATGAKFTWADGQNQWYGIRFRGEGANESVLDNCIVEHASGVNGYGGEILGVIDCNASSPTIKGCIINGSYTYGIQVYKGSFPSVSGNRIENHLNGGILIQPDSGGTYQGNIFTNNSSYALSYSGTNTINAIDNYWGDPSGPLDSSDDRATGGLYNPNGKGNKVSDHVNYYPWKDMPIGETSTYLVLTDKSAPFSIPAGAYVQVTDSAGSNTIKVESGAWVDFKNSAGANAIIFQEASSDFSVYRSGNTVLLTSNNNTIIQITAQSTAQSFYFTNGRADMVISGTKVMLGSQEITDTEEAAVENPNNSEQPPTTPITTLPTAVNAYLILTDNSVPMTIPYGAYVQVFGSDGGSTINVKSGAALDCKNFVGANVMNIEEQSSDFMVHRSGATVYLENSKTGTLIKIPATSSAQTLRFADGSSALIINKGKVMLGNQEITLTNIQMESPVNGEEIQDGIL